MALVGTLVLLAVPAQSIASAYSGEKIEDFRTRVNINKFGKAEITETISYNFGANEGHGIFRIYPISYTDKNGIRFDINFALKKVSQLKNGREIQEKYKLSSTNRDTITVRIGDPDRLVKGKHTYVISYTAQGIINDFQDYQEFYWNVTGNGWQVPIERASLVLSLEKGAILPTNNALICFTGKLGSVKQDCSATLDASGQAHFSLTRNAVLFSAEGLTVGVKLQKGSVLPMPLSQKIVNIIRNNWVVLIPVALFLFLLGKFLKNGRDPRGRGTIVPEFSPPQNLSPAELRVIIKEKFDMTAVSATIVDLARRGYLVIKEEKPKGFAKSKNYTFEKTEKTASDLTSFEKEILDGVTPPGRNNLRALQNHFYKTYIKLKKEVPQLLVKKEIFSRNVTTQRMKYYGGAVFFLALGAYFGNSWLWFVSWIICAGLMFVFSFLMPQKTKKGVLAYEQAMGLKMYINTAEKYPLQLAERQNRFETLLPYAMIFGLTKKWAKTFENMSLKSPDWYYGVYPFHPLYLASSLNNFAIASAKSLTANPASQGGSAFGGGGFSGGGFGGGGGGSW